jgi:hypothetical protein
VSQLANPMPIVAKTNPPTGVPVFWNAARLIQFHDHGLIPTPPSPTAAPDTEPSNPGRVSELLNIMHRISVVMPDTFPLSVPIAHPIALPPPGRSYPVDDLARFCCQSPDRPLYRRRDAGNFSVCEPRQGGPHPTAPLQVRKGR